MSSTREASIPGRYSEEPRSAGACRPNAFRPAVQLFTGSVANAEPGTPWEDVRAILLSKIPRNVEERDKAMRKGKRRDRSREANRRQHHQGRGSEGSRVEVAAGRAGVLPTEAMSTGSGRRVKLLQLTGRGDLSSPSIVTADKRGTSCSRPDPWKTSAACYRPKECWAGLAKTLTSCRFHQRHGWYRECQHQHQNHVPASCGESSGWRWA